MPPTSWHDGVDVPADEQDLLTPDERMALANLWEEGLDKISEKVKAKLSDSIMQTGFGGKAITHEQYLEYNGIIKGLNIFHLALSGQVETFIQELGDG